MNQSLWSNMSWNTLSYELFSLIQGQGWKGQMVLYAVQLVMSPEGNVWFVTLGFVIKPTWRDLTEEFTGGKTAKCPVNQSRQCFWSDAQSSRTSQSFITQTSFLWKTKDTFLFFFRMNQTEHFRNDNRCRSFGECKTCWSVDQTSPNYLQQFG